MTLCSSQAQQAGFGPRPGFQDTTCFVNKIRDPDIQIQKKRARAGALALFTKQLERLLMSSFIRLFLLPPAYWASPLLCPSPLFSACFSPRFLLLLLLLLPPFFTSAPHTICLCFLQMLNLSAPPSFLWLSRLSQTNKSKNTLSGRCC